MSVFDIPGDPGAVEGGQSILEDSENVQKVTENGLHEENADAQMENRPEDENVVVNGADLEDGIGREEYVALYQECIRVQVHNEKYAGQLQRIQKITKRLQNERRFLMKKLDGFGDDYRNAKIRFMEEEESRIANEAQEDDDEVVAAPKQQKKPLRKKVKVKRLQNAPKKPSNAFLMFCQKNRSVVQEEHQKMNKSEIGRQEMTRRLAEIWKETPTENKKEYYEMYEQDKVRYAEEMKKFESENPAKEETEQTPSADPAVSNSLPPNTNVGT